MPSDDVTISDRPDRKRYEIEFDGALAGVLTYEIRAGVITYRHTGIDPGQRRRGLGSWLVEFALDDARTRELAVRPLCPFVAAFIEDHPEYSDLLAR